MSLNPGMLQLDLAAGLNEQPQVHDQQLLGGSQTDGQNFVTITRGSSSEHMEEDVIPSSPIGFKQAMAKPLPALAIPTPPPRLQPWVTVATSRRSDRLAKKSLHRNPVVVAAQNILMKKLGLTSGPEITMDDVENYIHVFKEDISAEQAELISELFMQQVLTTELPQDD
jgi:hypothetical protein